MILCEGCWQENQRRPATGGWQEHVEPPGGWCCPAGKDDSGRYHKIGVDEQAFSKLFTGWYIAAHQDEPLGEIILDLDATDDPLYGRQEGTATTAIIVTCHYTSLPAITCYGPSCAPPTLMRPKVVWRQ